MRFRCKTCGHGPHLVEAEPAYQKGWAASEIVSAIVTIEKLLASGLLDHDEAATWERNYEVAQHRSDLELQARGLRRALDVLDPKGTCSSRRRLRGAA